MESEQHVENDGAESQDKDWFIKAFHRGGKWWGNVPTHITLGALYAGFVLWPLICFVVWGEGAVRELTGNRGFVGIWALVVSVAHPAWVFFETDAFNKWCSREKIIGEAEIKQRRKFEEAQRLADNFWKSVVATYTVGGILKLAADKV